MGMFDTIGIDLQLLPVTDEERKGINEEYGFQTKSLDCQLQQYDVLPDKTLIRWVEDKETGDEYLQHVAYTGNIVFYTNSDLGWVEFMATFENGVMTDIIAIK